MIGKIVIVCIFKGFFPGLIHVAYVLRPDGFFQKAISEVSNKFFKEEFKFKVSILIHHNETNFLRLFHTIKLSI